MKTILYTSLLILILLLSSTQAMAIGLGIYGNLGKGSNTRVDPALYSFEDTHVWTGFGFILDTAVAKNKLFNYRLNLGLEKWDWNNDHFNNVFDGEVLRFSLYNTFGFGVVKTKPVRFWLGPQLGLNIFTQNYGGSSSIGDLFQLTENNGGIGATIGLASGLNFNLGRTFTLGVDGGARMWDYYLLNLDPTHTKQHERSYELYANLVILFRINDVYLR